MRQKESEKKETQTQPLYVKEDAYGTMLKKGLCSSLLHLTLSWLLDWDTD